MLKLPGLDSNQDKESQKVFQPRRNPSSDKAFREEPILFDAGLRETQNPAAFGPDLARLIDAWPTLPEALKVGILAMIDAARK